MRAIIDKVESRCTPSSRTLAEVMMLRSQIFDGKKTWLWSTVGHTVDWDALSVRNRMPKVK